MNTPDTPSLRPRATTAERWEYVILGGSNRPAAPKEAEVSYMVAGLRLLGSTPALVFLSGVLAAAALAPQTPGAHNWAAERAAQSAMQPATGAGAGVTP